MSELEILNSASNAVIARHSDREYPGVLIQGDILRIFLDDLDELREALDAVELDSAKEISEALQERIKDLLIHYENVLDEKGLPLPYMNSVRG